jgi:predicted dienelactone hydrolase
VDGNSNFEVSRLVQRLQKAGLTFFFCLTAATVVLAAQPMTARRADGANVPLMAFAATNGNGCPPLAVLSPGAGGTENTLSYLANGLRNGGWNAVVVGHRESGPGALSSDVMSSGVRRGLLALTTDRNAYNARFMDIGAAIAAESGRCRPPFKALLGHSMGAATVMLEAGAKNKLGLTGQDRFDAYVAMSPQGPGSIFPQNAWSGIGKPVLVLTGTRDNALEGRWQARTVPFSDMPRGCKWLGVIRGATHMNFAGGGWAAKTEALTVKMTLAFLDGLRTGRCGSPPEMQGISVQAK